MDTTLGLKKFQHLPCTVNIPLVSAASLSPPGRAPLGFSSSPRAEPSSQSRALWPSCHTLPAGTHRGSREREKKEISGPATDEWKFYWLISAFLPWASPPVCRQIQLWASFSPSEPGCSSTLDPASRLTPVPPLSAPVAPAENVFKKQKKLRCESTGPQATFSSEYDPTIISQ